MEINNLIYNIKKKLLENIFIENIIIEDKTYLHVKHSSHNKSKFHLKLIVFSNNLKMLSKIDATKKIHNLLHH